MFPFERATTTDDDLLVLAAYAAAERELIRSRKQMMPPALEGSRGGAMPPRDADHTDERTPPPRAGNDASPVRESTTEAKASTSAWVQRLRTIEGVSRDRMVPIHGRLIAHGLLQFQLLGHSDGVVYRLTTEGRVVLADANTAGEGDAEAA